MDNRKISVCIPSWNRYELTIKAFENILLDERVDEIVIVDDCSTDTSWLNLMMKQVEYVERGINKVVLYRNETNLDCYRNKHEAVLKAKNEWCILFDSDNLLYTEYLDVIFAISEWDTYTVYQPQFARPHFDFRSHAGVIFGSTNIKNYLHTNVMTAMNAMNFFINRSEYLKVWDGCIDPVTSDSIYFNYCWLKRGNRFYITPGLEYDHLVHKGHYQENVHRTGNFHKELLKLFETVEIDTMQNIDNQQQPTSIPSIIDISTIHAAYVNLTIRPDRNQHMVNELSRVGIQAERFPAFSPEDVMKIHSMDKLNVMYKRTKGAIGCHYSQVGIMEDALKAGKHAWVMEDDLVYCDDIQDRLGIIFDYLNTHEWDIFWFGGTWHKDVTWHKSTNGHHTHPDLTMCTCDLNRDWEETDNPNIVRTYGAFSTHSYIVNVKSLPKILDLLDQNVYRSMGIDWIMLLIQPELNAYAFNYGCCKQYDNQSNIGSGISYFSGFHSLGEHWFKQKL